MEKIKLGKTDVIFQEFGDGKGKIIVSDDEYGYNFSYSWGAMGKDTTLKQFVKSVGSDYFVKKLSNNVKGTMNVRKTFINLRTYIQECFEYELKWYEHMEFQKDFRERLKTLQKHVNYEHEFIDKVMSFHNQLDFYLIKNRNEMQRLEDLFKDIFNQSEPWHFIVNETHPEEIFLTKLHAKLKKTLSKPVQLCLF